MKDQVRGKAEEIKGKVTGDRGEEMKGKARQAVAGPGDTSMDKLEKPDHMGETPEESAEMEVPKPIH